MKNYFIKVPSSLSDSLYNMFMSEFQLVQTPCGKIVAVNVSDPVNMFPVNKVNVSNALRKLYFSKEHRTVNYTPIKNAWAMISAVSGECAVQKQISRLVFQQKDAFYYNLSDINKVAEITSTQIRLTNYKNIDVLFYPKSGERMYTKRPNLNAEPEDFYNIIHELFPVKKEQLLLLCTYIVSSFIPNINHPILIVTGEYGAAKSFSLRLIKKIIDPSSGDDLIPLPKDPEDIASILSENYFTAFDNVSFISSEVSDMLCMAVTGGTYQKRKLYTDSEVMSLDIHRPVALTGIDLSLRYADLMDRSIVFELPRIKPEKRITEEELWERFYKHLPDIQGSIFKILALALYTKEQNPELPSLPRLADFAMWSYYIAESIEDGWGEMFLEQYNDNIKRANNMSIDNDPLLSSVKIFMNSIDSWKGTASELLQQITEIYFNNNISSQLPKSFPTSANSLSRRLKSHGNDLEMLGITAGFGRDTDRYIILNKIA